MIQTCSVNHHKIRIKLVRTELKALDRGFPHARTRMALTRSMSHPSFSSAVVAPSAERIPLNFRTVEVTRLMETQITC